MPPITVDSATPFFVVMNAGSGHDDATETRETIERVLTEAGREHELHLVDKPDRLHDVARETVDAARARGAVVVAAGGDGTINAVAHATYRSGCTFGVLPQGTFNYFSRTHGIPFDTAEATQLLLRSRAHPVQVGLVNDRLFLVNASLGLYPELLENREAYKKRLGRSRPVAMVAALVTLLRQHRQLRLRIEQPDRSRDMRTPTLFIGNNLLQLQQIGIEEAPALLHNQLVAVALRPVGTLAMLWLLARGAMGSLGEADDVLSFAFDSITVQPRQRGRRMKVATDGEVLWLDAPIRFQVGPEPLYLIKPEPGTEVVE